MFKDTKEGQTHYENDGCGEPAHNKKKKPLLFVPFSEDDFLPGNNGIEYLNEVLWLLIEEVNALKLLIKTNSNAKRRK